MPHRERHRRLADVGEQRSPRLRFGPGFGYALTVGLMLLVSGFLLSRLPDLRLEHTLLALGVGAMGLALLGMGWEWYRLDGEGLERRRVGRVERWTWAQLGGIAGTQVDSRAPGGAHLAVGVARGSFGPLPGTARMTRYEVTDADGWVLFRIGPWVRARGRLAAEIRRRSTAAHRS